MFKSEERYEKVAGLVHPQKKKLDASTSSKSTGPRKAVPLLAGLLILAALHWLAAGYLLGLRGKAEGRPPLPCPYYFVDHLEDAVRIDVPFHATHLESGPPVYVVTEELRTTQNGVDLHVSPFGGRIGGGAILISTPLSTENSAAASVALTLEPGTSHSLSGYVRYWSDMDLLDLCKVADFIPKAFVSWEGWDGGIGSSSFDLTAPIPRAGDPVSPDAQSRSCELLDLVMKARIMKRIDSWNYFEVPVDVPPEGKGIRFHFEALQSCGEMQFADLKLQPVDPAARLIREGAYRFHPSNESTFRLKKMYRIDDAYKSCILALPPSRFSFELELPALPSTLECFTGFAGNPGDDSRGELLFSIEAGVTVDGPEEVLFQEIMDAGAAPPDWHPHTLNLDRFAGKKIQLSFETRWKSPGARADSLAPVWGSPVLYERSPKPSRPNVLLLSIDCTREDRLGIHGHARDCTPRIDRLAEQGTDFLNVYTPCDYTYLLLPMLMTGKIMRFDWLGSFNRMDLNRRTLAELMKENGYLVEGLCEDYYYNGFWKGFPSRPFLKNIHADRRDSLLLDKALHFMDAHKETPSFVWIHLRGAHPPISDENSFFFIEQEGLSEMSARLRRLTGETDLWTAITRILVPDWNGEGPRIPDEAKEEAELLANELYDGRLRYIDSLVGDLLDELERRAILDRTLLAITSDHGITFQKDFFMSRASREVGARVPLILRWPGRIPANRKVSERVSTIDLFPTILEALDIHPPAGLTGHSLLPLCGGAGDYPSTPLLFVGLNQSMVYFENYRYSCRPIYLSVLLAPDADLEGPPLEGERLSLLGIGDGGEEKDLKEECHDQLVKGRRYLVEFWNAMDACSDGGPVNSALVQFFQKAGYMR